MMVTFCTNYKCGHEYKTASANLIAELLLNTEGRLRDRHRANKHNELALNTTSPQPIPGRVVIGNYIKVESAMRMKTEWLVLLTRVI